MKILAIRIRNLTSLAGDTEIDFTKEPLASAGIFAITGSTGAGKSTILDALCLALYGKTPRYKQAENTVDITDVKGATIKQDDVRATLRDGAAEGAASVDFVATDGLPYRATWSVRRARNKIDGNLQAYEMALLNLHTHQPIPGKKTELLERIEALVGLQFEQFTRSVLLAQGDFTAFLKAGRDEKSALLEKLTGTFIYSEISKKIFEKHKEKALQVRELELRVKDISLLSEEEEQAVYTEKSAVETALSAQENLQKSLEKAKQWHQVKLKLSQEVQEALQEEQQLQQIISESEAEKIELEEIKSAQSARPIFEQLKALTAQKASEEEQKNQNQLSLQSLQVRVQKTQHDWQLQNDELQQLKAEEMHLRPEIELARKLDQQIQGYKKDQQQWTLSISEKEKKKEEVQVNLHRLNEQISLLNRSIQLKIEWKNARIEKMAIAENHSLIEQQLIQAQDALQFIRVKTIRLKELVEQSTAYAQSINMLDQQAQEAEKTIQGLTQELTNEELQLAEVEVVNWRADLEWCNKQLFSLLKIQQAWTSWHQEFLATQEKELLLQRLEKDFQNQEQQVQILTSALGKATERKDLAYELYDSSRQLANPTVEGLRAELRSGEPCPVCGSTEHPFGHESDMAAKILSELAQKWKEEEKNYQELYAEHLNVQGLLRQTEREFLSLQQTVKEKKEWLLQQEEQDVLAHSPEIFKSLGFSERSSWLISEINRVSEQSEARKRQIQQFEEAQQHSKNLSQKLNDLLLEEKGRQTEKQKLLLQLQYAEKEQVRLKEEQGEREGKLNEIKAGLSKYFNKEQWYENWTAAPQKFLLQIQEFAVAWKENEQVLTTDTRNRDLHLQELTFLQTKMQEITEEITAAKKELDGVERNRALIEAQRLQCLEGRAVEEVQQNLSGGLTKVGEALDSTKEILIEVEKQLAAEERLRDKLEQVLQRLEEQLREQNVLLSNWLEEFNKDWEDAISERKLAEWLQFDESLLQEKEKRFRGLEERMKANQTLLEERKRKLAEHENSGERSESEEEIARMLGLVLKDIEEKRAKWSELNVKIKNQETNKEKLGDLLDELRKEQMDTSEWAKLNELIGSADGKKFRQYAQEYTLEVLLGYANVHLNKLSSRYVLERIPNSLGLQVVDQDMADEIRSVYSLSGGESFLVSLALALGLATLSSSKIKVESLFIDEGFGSLDPETLNMAMEALERLHHQGRKVGVISHVQEMTERIPVQIQVEKMRGGASRVQIIGY